MKKKYAQNNNKRNEAIFASVSYLAGLPQLRHKEYLLLLQIDCQHVDLWRAATLYASGAASDLSSEKIHTFL